MSRPSPSQSATDYDIGTKKLGNDGNHWVVTETKTGTHRWSPASPYKKGRKYQVHDNGGRPFTVYLCDASTVAIFNTYTDKLVKVYEKVNKIFIGKYQYKSTRGKVHKMDGNSILLQVGNKYVEIGWDVYEFKTDDEIVKYYSFVGNSDVPYPVAMGEKYVYFMLDHVYIDKEKLIEIFGKDIDWEDGYRRYYELIEKKGKLAKEKEVEIKKMKGYKLIAMRLA